MVRGFDTFVGVALGGAKGKSTAVARLEQCGPQTVRVVAVDTRNRDNAPFHDEPLVAHLLESSEHTAVAIDAPLTLPACIRCVLPSCPGFSTCPDPAVSWLKTTTERIPPGKSPQLVELSRVSNAPTWRKPTLTPYTQRACDVRIERELGLPQRESLGQGAGPLTARAAHIRRALAPRFQLDQNLIEVWPRATIQRLFGSRTALRYKRDPRTSTLRAKLLEQLSSELEFAIWRERCLENPHLFDAVIAAFTLFLWARESWSIPEHLTALAATDGWIWVPPKRAELSDQAASSPSSDCQTR